MMRRRFFTTVAEDALLLTQLAGTSLPAPEKDLTEILNGTGGHGLFQSAPAHAIDPQRVVLANFIQLQPEGFNVFERGLLAEIEMQSHGLHFGRLQMWTL